MLAKHYGFIATRGGYLLITQSNRSVKCFITSDHNFFKEETRAVIEFKIKMNCCITNLAFWVFK